MAERIEWEEIAQWQFWLRRDLLPDVSPAEGVVAFQRLLAALEAGEAMAAALSMLLDVVKVDEATVWRWGNAQSALSTYRQRVAPRGEGA